MKSSKLETILASLSAILAYRSRVQGSNQTSNGRSIDREDETNTYGLPDGELIAEGLTRWYRRQRKAVLMEIPKPSGLLPLILPLHLTSLASRSWIDPMARSMVPRLAPIWEDSYRTSKGRLERTRAIAGGVSNPHLRAAIERQAFAFCRATNEATSKRLETALDDLKHELVKGLIDRGESIEELKDRVNEIFDGLEEHQARRIAATEASRALHAAQEMAAIESGVVAGKELLISADACELCQMVATEAKRVRIGQAFAIIGNHPEYQTIEMPPIHPNCRCTAIDILMPEYGGPAEVDWASTLIQPQERLGKEYLPPPGMEIPKPEPERIL